MFCPASRLAFKYIRQVGWIFPALAAACTHYDWGSKSAAIDDTPDSGVVVGDDLETVVAYSVRGPVTKEAVCGDASYQIPFSLLCGQLHVAASAIYMGY